jgi:hypothetical protein
MIIEPRSWILTLAETIRREVCIVSAGSVSGWLGLLLIEWVVVSGVLVRGGRPETEAIYPWPG